MRYSFSQLIQMSRDICISDQSVSYTGMSDDLTFIKREINNTVQSIYAMMKEYKLRPGPRTASTVATQVYYSNPPDFSKLESVTITSGTVNPLRIVQSQEEWDRLTQITMSGLPTHVFPRQYDFGLYPTPGAVYTMTLNGNYNPVNMVNADYTDGTVTTTLNSTAVTGASTIFTAAMVNRWFAITSDGIAQGNWYKVNTYTSGTVIAITPTFAEASGATQNYLIGESPEIPVELHEYIPYRVGSVYWHTRRHEPVRAQELSNYFFTGEFGSSKRTGTINGGILGTLHDLQMKGRGNSNLIETGGVDYNSNYITNTIWGTVLF
jgi:hypothetical protein